MSHYKKNKVKKIDQQQVPQPQPIVIDYTEPTYPLEKISKALLLFAECSKLTTEQFRSIPASAWINIFKPISDYLCQESTTTA